MDKLVEYLCIIQARVSSTRLPGKIMLDLAGKTLLERVYETVIKSNRVNKTIVATSNELSDDIIECKLNALGICCFRGSLNNVLERFYTAAQKYEAKNIVRITADNPLMDSKVIDDLIRHYEKNTSEYSMFTNAIYGLSAEVFSFNAIKSAYENTRNDFDREHVTPYIKDFSKVSITDVTEKYKLPNLSATVDTLDDYLKMQNFYLYCQKYDFEANIDRFIEKMSDKS